MKNILVLSILFCAIAMPVLAELTAEDLEKIRQIVKDSETELKAEIEKTDSNLRAEIEKTNTKLDGIDARLRTVETGVAELRGRNIGVSVVKDWLVAICAVVAVLISIIALRRTKSLDTPAPQDTQKVLS